MKMKRETESPLRAIMNFVLPSLEKEEEEEEEEEKNIEESTMDALLNFFLLSLKKEEEEEEEEENRGSTMHDLKIMDDLKLVILLPPDIITEILSRLPADSAIGCRCICKQWRSLIDHPYFRDTHTRQLISSSSSTSNPKKFGNYLIPNSSSSSCGFFLCAQQHEHRYKLEVIEYNDGGSGDEKSVHLEFKPSKPITYHPFSFHCDTWGSLKISSCNGLVFMGSDKPHTNAFVCNPFTREYVHLHIPTPLLLERERKGYMAYGFGYLPSTNEYKVVSIYYDDNTAAGKVGVYTLGSGKWRNKGEIPYWINNTPFYPGWFANGAIHWFTENQEIVSFDLANEEFRFVVPFPPPAVGSPDCVVKHGVLGGCLCVTRSDHTTGLKEIWVLNVLTTNDNKEELSWNKKLSIPIWKGYTDDSTPRVVTKTGKILWCGGSGSDLVRLVSYDPKTEIIVYGKAFPSSGLVKVIPYTKSFVSLKALGEKDAKCFGEGSVALVQALLCAQQQH